VEGLEALWQPIEVGGLTLPNRILMSAHTPLYDPDRYAAYVAERAREGPGLIVTGAVSVHPTSATPGRFITGWADDVEASFRKVADAVHEHDRVVFAQIYHNGHHHTGTHSLDDWHALLAPSPIASPIVGILPKQIEQEEIDEIVGAFADVAAAAKAGGIDGVEVHAAHGYLLHEFLSPMTNRRADAYGGGAENRVRLTLEVAQAIRERCGPDYPIGLKIAFDEFVGESGITPEVAAEHVRLLHTAGLFAYVSVSSGNYHSLHFLIAPMSSDKSGHFAEHSARAKQVVGELPVMVTGAVKTVERAAEIVSAGQADMVGMSRAFFADPGLVRKARDGRASEIRRCVGANQACWRRLVYGLDATCTVNPVAGREREWANGRIGRAASPRSVLVVGGGPAGLKAAEAAAQRGHRVTLVEQEAELGGQLCFAARLPHRANWAHVAEDAAGSLDRLGVDVRLGTTASAGLPEELGAEVTILATGASWDKTGFSILRPDRESIPGSDAVHVLSAVEAIADPEACGARVIILDENGDYTAPGLAELLTDKGRTVEIVTVFPFVGIKLMPAGTVDYAWVYPRLAEAGVALTTHTFVEDIRKGVVTLRDAWSGENKETAADTVVLVMGRRSNDDLYHALKQQGREVVRIGDCVAPREVDDATYEGMQRGLSV
jgi:2,4-dienoyl-CoA reductase-like NADH-dependent reductase (Old Yellow Enzyme family)